ncbi:MAG: hypothetical protein AUK44_07375 [Porphyromonadaceae bacterium CG2_30_38_12]|nr:MAG: hypothetical protein AUK44_07375 [Porphyromonadaceae bacterium CG2_30_38_12]
MFVVLLFMFAGIAIGCVMRKIKFRFVNKIILLFILLLLLLLGIVLGADEKLLKQFHLLGFQSFIIAFFATLGSVVAAKILWNIGRTKRT